jgi:DNA-binding MarR family transcriptional regulator
LKRAARQEITPLLDDQAIGLEARSASDDHLSLRLWLRLLACSTDIETEIRKRLRAMFGMTLARFDYLAQLHRHAQGLRMSALSRYLMVTGGNVTGLTDELEKDGMVQRDAEPGDRRSYRVALTPKGRKIFERMASEHEGWVIDLFGGIADADRQQLYNLLGRLRVQLSAPPEPPEERPSP